MPSQNPPVGTVRGPKFEGKWHLLQFMALVSRDLAIEVSCPCGDGRLSTGLRTVLSLKLGCAEGKARHEIRHKTL